MSVPEKLRRQGKLEVIIKAYDVSNYTNKILSNRNKFPEEFDNVLGDDLKRNGQAIYRYCRLANDLRVLKPVSGEIDEEAREARYRLQKNAIQACTELSICIDMAYGLYHLSEKRIKHWKSLTNTARSYIKKWYASDIKRYGKP